MFRNFLHIIREGLSMDGTGKLVLWIVVAIAFSALCWWACTHYTKLWNKRYHVTDGFHVLCGAAAVVTFLATLGFIGLKNMRPVAERMVDTWSDAVMQDSDLSAACFHDAYYAIKDSGLENMRGYKAPEQGGDLIPISRKETQILVGQIYAGNACRNFSVSYPFIGYFIKAHDGVPSEIIAADVNAFFKSRRGQTYPLEQGFVLAIDQISSDLQSQCGRIVRITRSWLVILFLLVQLVPFGLVGYLAYEALRRGRRSGGEQETSYDELGF